MHTHFSATAAISAFFSVLVLGTLWRLLAAHMARSDSPIIQSFGQAMAFQY
jgi:hypothetical protein